MKGIVFTPDDKMYVKEFDEPLYKSIGAEVGGYIEIVHPKGLPEPYMMVVNEEGLLQKLDFNTIGSFWYQTLIHGNPIVGNIVVAKEGFNEDGERDILGLNDEEIFAFKLMAISVSGGAIKEVNP